MVARQGTVLGARLVAALLAALGVALVLPRGLGAQEDTSLVFYPRRGNVYYAGRTFGSEATFTPLSAMLHSGFWQFQIDNRGDDPFALPYGVGAENVLRNLIDPIGAINQSGWERFVFGEVLPSPRRERGQWVANYFGHLVGEGLVYRTTYEWYRHHGIRHARLFAVVNVLTGAAMNEVVENGGFTGANVDPIADFYIFNPLAILLFSSDGATRFMHDRLGLAYWPQQALWDPVSATLENVGYRVAFRIHPDSSRVGLFALYSTHGLVGGSYRLRPDLTLSIGGGVAAQDLVDVPGPAGSHAVTVTLGPAAGMFLDRDGSLLASLVVAPTKHEQLLLNVYPGVVGFLGFEPGVTAIWDSENGLMFGLNLAGLPMGFGAGSAP